MHGASSSMGLLSQHKDKDSSTRRVRSTSCQTTNISNFKLQMHDSDPLSSTVMHSASGTTTHDHQDVKIKTYGYLPTSPKLSMPDSCLDLISADHLRCL